MCRGTVIWVRVGYFSRSPQVCFSTPSQALISGVVSPISIPSTTMVSQPKCVPTSFWGSEFAIAYPAAIGSCIQPLVPTTNYLHATSTSCRRPLISPIHGAKRSRLLLAWSGICNGKGEPSRMGNDVSDVVISSFKPLFRHPIEALKHLLWSKLFRVDYLKRNRWESKKIEQDFPCPFFFDSQRFFITIWLSKS